MHKYFFAAHAKQNETLEFLLKSQHKIVGVYERVVMFFILNLRNVKIICENK